MANATQRIPSVRWEERTGRPSEVRAALRRAVAAYTRDIARFTIGRTNNPNNRARGYPGYDEMIVIYQTDSEVNADEVEDDLVEFFRDHADNFNGGGGGPMGEPSHYIYVVIEF